MLIEIDSTQQTDFERKIPMSDVYTYSIMPPEKKEMTMKEALEMAIDALEIDANDSDRRGWSEAANKSRKAASLLRERSKEILKGSDE